MIPATPIEDKSAMAAMIADHHETLYGSHGVPGVAYKVGIMWRIHVWVLCTLSGVIGVIGTIAVQKYMHAP